MLLRCNYEEVTALNHGAHVFLTREDEGGGCAVVAPPESRSAVEALVSRLEGDLVVETLADQKAVQLALEVIVECLREDMEAAVLEMHPADEDAVAAYFDFAHALSVRGRIHDLGREMAAVIELVTGREPTAEVALTFQFPD